MGQHTFTHLTETFRFDEAFKAEILRRWMAVADVAEALGRHEIATSFFGRYFGSKVINYAVGVIEGVNRLGNCPVIGVMLIFFEKKNLPLEDVFLVCVNLKNTLIDYALERGVLTHEVLHELSCLVDRNFYGVIGEYLRLHYEKAPEGHVCTMKKEGDEAVVLHCTTMAPAGIGDKRVTSALEYADDVEIEGDILAELGEIEAEALSSLGLTESISPEARSEVVDLFMQYAKMVERLVEFQELSYALWMLTDLLRGIDTGALGEESTYVVIYLKAIIGDLSVWRRSVFVERSAADIHYLDKTLLSSIAQLQILLSPAQPGLSEEVEFF